MRNPPLALHAAAASLAFEQESPGAAGFFSLLLWAAAEGVSHLWTFCTLRPHLLVQLLGERCWLLCACVCKSVPFSLNRHAACRVGLETPPRVLR